MKNKLKTKSLTTKSIMIVVICSVIFMLIASPIIQAITFDIFNPYLIENITMKTSDCAVYMSMFLARANPTMYFLTRYDNDFLVSVNDLANNIISSDEFSKAITENIQPFTTEFAMNDEQDYSAVSYPVIYIEGEGIFCNEAVSEAANNLVSSEWFKDYQTNHNGRYLYAPIIYQEENGEQQGYFSYVYSGFSDNENNTRYYAILLTRYTEILPLWDSVLELGIDDYGFLGNDNTILYQNIENSQWKLDWIQENLASGRQHYVITHEENGEMYYSALVSYELEQFRFVMRVSKDVFSDLFSSFNWLIQTILLVLVVVFLLIISIILRQIFKRLTALSDKMAVVQHGDYNVKLDDSSEDEIGQLASAFNIMTSKVQDNVNELVEKEKREKMLQYNLMVSSIDPHFIYNTLNTSTRLAELGRADEVVIVNDALINCLKDNLKMKNFQSFDTVANEIDTLEQYITIQNHLCDNTVSLEYSMTDADMQLEIPKFLLQPLVENSILHGILMNIDKDGNMIAGKIKIDVKKADSRIRISIKDNGIGMSQETIEQYFYTDENVILNEKAHYEHIGVLNMRTRLSYLYNDDYSISVKSFPGKGTEIVIEIPVN